LADGIKKKINNVIVDTIEKDVQTFWNNLIYLNKKKRKRYNPVIADTTEAINKRESYV
jgi:hypothetical protein